MHRHGADLERPRLQDREAATILVAINSVFQIVAFAGLGYFFLQVFPGWLGLPGTARLDVSVWGIAKSVLIFLGIPSQPGSSPVTWERSRGRDWYKSTLLPKVGPTALYGLLFTIVVLFPLRGDTITNQPLDVARVSLPLLAYFGPM